MAAASSRRGEVRGGLALTEPDAGTDLQAIRTTARRDGDDYVINGTKTWISNGIEGSCFALLVKTDPEAKPRHKGMSLFIAPKQKGFTVGRKLEKLGYKSIDSGELVFEDYRVPADHLIGGVEGQGFYQATGGLELGPHQRRGARRRRRRGRAEARHRLRAGAQDLRQADLRAPGDPAQARRDGDARPRRAAADARCGRRLRSRRALRHGSRHGQVFRLRGGAGEHASSRCASTAATATPRSSTSSGSTAMRR